MRVLLNGRGTFAAVALLCAASLLCQGCSRGDKFTTYPTNVRIVDQQNQPVVDVNVLMSCDEHGLSATGLTGEDGVCAMTTFDKLGDGVVAGTHRVALSMPEAAPELSAPRKRAAKPLIPARMANPATSGIQIVVTPEGPREIPIQIPSR